ncbi:uncharacterized protein NPIL_325911 [Nephila pilipes]|uniref:Gustatory receptor n=1 Tax=Nephila pilipes TaxID=299642 RepID=A0A8X6R2Q1_NEPPI|nr:uncharacterized protein NPIL_654951 [Nephila pilipes]GFU52065.1 uncharacterized protein NPIL_325911 [Nephila pilipes]
MTLTVPGEIAAKYDSFGYTVENPVAQILLVSIKTFTGAIVYPVFTNIVTLIFCSLCQHCCTLIDNLTQDVLKIPPEAFGPHQQIDVFRHKARIDDVLENLQAIFSLPSFLIIVANFLSCGSIVGWFLHFSLGSYEPFMIVESVFNGFNAFGCLVTVLWTAGSLPIRMQKLKEAFHNKSHLRLFTMQNFEESQLRRELFEKPDFVFTGCDMISYRRSSVLAAIGTLLTYTVLVITSKSE